ncbi:hypothetical protein COSO111634_08270 [Corallococcus soli]
MEKRPIAAPWTSQGPVAKVASASWAMPVPAPSVVVPPAAGRLSATHSLSFFLKTTSGRPSPVTSVRLCQVMKPVPPPAGGL